MSTILEEKIKAGLEQFNRKKQYEMFRAEEQLEWFTKFVQDYTKQVISEALPKEGDWGFWEVGKIQFLKNLKDKGIIIE